ncbi:murein biosynthesis integral membrane protein MurJ [Aminipila luticellarii]|uniref:Probable lipid II flippase MurJ n=1 Tax=Aminipila luticellarii TaxID=2507160 RepID=A0A410PSL9_9FIRM|nr:murein biosynthesis integral membrane protein MurJ [Aminipila luticellarii]QAT41895.1 murein biosynthesis integral membrane protein MurJ [Aminipila luticellarii]
MKENIIRTAILMSILTLGSQFLGFIRELVMANYFGTSYIVDAFAMSNTILNLLFGGLIVAITSAYMPLYSKVVAQRGSEEGEILTSQAINLLLCVTLILSLIGIVFSDQIIAVCAGGFTGETARLASYYIKVIFSYIIFSSITGIFEPYLQYRGIFIPQIISGYFISFSSAIVIVISAYTSYYYIAYGMLIGNVLRFLCVSAVAKKNGYRHRATLSLKGEASGVLSLALPIFLGSSVDSISKFIDRTLASHLREGSIAALNYANLIDNMIIIVTITVISTLIYPKLTQAYAVHDNTGFNKLVSVGCNLVVMIAIPCSLGAMLYSRQIIQIVYERGAFGSGATAMTVGAFFFYSMGLLFVAMNQFLTKVYYSMHNMKVPMILGMVSVGFNIVLNLILIGPMQHEGLALASSVASGFNMCLLFFYMKYKYSDIIIFPSKGKLGMIFGSAGISVSLSYVLYKSILESIHAELIRLALVVLFAILIYGILLKIFKIEEINLIKKIV